MKSSMVILGFMIAGQAACVRTVALRERPVDNLAHGPSKAWITAADGNPVEVFLPRVSEGTIFGWAGGERVSIRVEDVREVKVRKIDPVRTAIVTGAVLAAGTGVILWRLSKPATPTGCEYFNGQPAEETEETGTLGICSL